MTVVVDANALVALMVGEPEGPVVAERVEQWLADDREIHAPALARYEVANVLTRQLATGLLSREDMKTGWQALEELPIIYHALLDGPAVIDAATKLRRRSAFDAACLALALSLDAELWTLDGPLARNAIGQKLPVRLFDSRDAAEEIAATTDTPTDEPSGEERSPPSA
ncbi:MAG TPA: type II toxin-antitoxin system VapC family toxin [Solirubrobacteraceae bacterium]|nr:type II toxin-antitoxin system VapC family toxin [Solirubrobacteraceae bacterium]